MPVTKLLAQTCRLALATALALPQISQAADSQTPIRKVIFPGQTMPNELGYKTLKVGPTGDVQVSARDWFLLKDKNLALSNPVPGKHADYSGPILDAQNTQLYFRVVSGMILKQSMIQMGMSSAAAKRYIQEVTSEGKNFDEAPLDLEALPPGLDKLAADWERPIAKLTMLPYLLLPLSVAYDQSQFQHFSKGLVEDPEQQKSCSTINTVAPLAPVHNKILEKQKALESIETELRNATARLKESNGKALHMNESVVKLGKEIFTKIECVGKIKDRVSRGSAMPDQACMDLAATIMAHAKVDLEGGGTKAWAQFTSRNFKNERGDYTIRNETKEQQQKALGDRDLAKKALESALDRQATAEKIKKDSQEKIERLTSDLEIQKANAAVVLKEKAELQTELRGIQDMNAKIENGEFLKEKGEAEFTKENSHAQSVGRARRLNEIRLRQQQLVSSENKLTVSQEALITQIEHLRDTIDKQKALLQEIDRELNTPVTGLTTRVPVLEAELRNADAKYQKAENDAKFSEYILSILNKKVNDLSDMRAKLLDGLTKEAALAETYKKQIEAAEKIKETQFGPLLKEVSGLEALIASYRDVAHMGWFLETDCAARSAFSEGHGVYLSRAKIADTQTKIFPTTPVDAGRWGLFNMNYEHFRGPIQAGVLLDVQANVQLAVQQLIENYDNAMTQTFDPQVQKCADAETPKGTGGATLNSMRAAFSIWIEGNDKAAKSRALACRAPASNGSQSVNPVRAFQASLNKLIAFEGSVLDAALPQASASQGGDLIEREAITMLAKELGALTGLNNGSKVSRDKLIRALLKVLAKDYDQEISLYIAKRSTLPRVEYVQATEGPGRSSSMELQAGSEYQVATIGRVKLFSDPIAKAAKEIGELSLHDKVTVLPLENGGTETIRSGWIRVRSGDREGWMSPSALGQGVILDENGQILGQDKIANCDDPKLATIQGKSQTVPRMTSNLRVVKLKNGSHVLDPSATAKMTPASPKKIYLACENFELNGAVAAVRLVEARVAKAANGHTLYIPVEDVGGFVLANPKLEIGAAIDPATWSQR